MEGETNQKVEEYLKLLGYIKNRVEDERTAVAILTELNKDRRMDLMRQERQQRNGKPASKKQLAYLKKLGVDIGEYSNLTKAQASELIDQALEE